MDEVGAPLTMLLFHHITKTAGTSLLAVIRKNYGADELHEFYGETDDPAALWRTWFRSLSAQARRALRCVASHTAQFLIPVLLEEGVEFKVITLLRDPVERCISLYYFTRELAAQNEQGLGGFTGRALLEQNWSLDDIYRTLGGGAPGTSPLHGKFPAFFNGQTRDILRPYRCKIEFSTQATLRDLPHMATLHRVMSHYLVGITEEYNRSVDYLREALSWKSACYEAINVTRSRRSAPLPSEETIELIRSYNRVDLELYTAFKDGRATV